MTESEALEYVREVSGWQQTAIAWEQLALGLTEALDTAVSRLVETCDAEGLGRVRAVMGEWRVGDSLNDEVPL